MEEFIKEYKRLCFNLSFIFNTDYFVKTEENYRLSGALRSESLKIANALFDKYSEGDLIDGSYNTNQDSYLIYEEKSHCLIDYLMIVKSVLNKGLTIESCQHEEFFNFLLNCDVSDLGRITINVNKGVFTVKINEQGKGE